MIQFHQSYAYEDFIQGYRPNPDSEGGFTLTNGIFFEMCKRAENNPQSKYVLTIDEINRGMTIDIGFAFYNESITIIDV